MQKKPVPKCENNVTTDAKGQIKRESFLFGKGKGKLEQRRLWFGLRAFVGYFALRGPGFCFVYRTKNAIGKYISEANRSKTIQMPGIFGGESIHVNRNTDITYIVSPSEKVLKVS